MKSAKSTQIIRTLVHFSALLCVTFFCLALFNYLLHAFLLALPPTKDYSITSLPSDYELWRFNSHQICLVTANEDGLTANIVIPAQVIAICFNDQYIGIQQASPPSLDDDLAQWTHNNPSLPRKYYLVNATNGKINGPYESTLEFKDFCQSANITNMTDWYSPEELLANMS